MSIIIMATYAFVGLILFDPITGERAKMINSRREDWARMFANSNFNGDREQPLPENTTDEREFLVISWHRSILLTGSIAFVAAANTFLHIVTFMLLPGINQTLKIRPVLNVITYPIHNLLHANCVLMAAHISVAIGPRTTLLAGLALQTISVVACATAKQAAPFLACETLSAIATALIATSQSDVIGKLLTGKQSSVASTWITIGPSVGAVAAFPIGAAFGPEAERFWRGVYFFIGTINAIAFILAFAAVPFFTDAPLDCVDGTPWSWKERWRRFTQGLDWVGFLLQFTTMSALGMSVIGLTWLSASLQKPLCISGGLATILLALCFVL
jgi:predicted MFS family arabinose efflux permease